MKIEKNLDHVPAWIFFLVGDPRSIEVNLTRSLRLEQDTRKYRHSSSSDIVRALREPVETNGLGLPLTAAFRLKSLTKLRRVLAAVWSIIITNSVMWNLTLEVPGGIFFRVESRWIRLTTSEDF